MNCLATKMSTLWDFIFRPGREDNEDGNSDAEVIIICKMHSPESSHNYAALSVLLHQDASAFCMSSVQHFCHLKDMSDCEGNSLQAKREVMPTCHLGRRIDDIMTGLQNMEHGRRRALHEAMSQNLCRLLKPRTRRTCAIVQLVTAIAFATVGSPEAWVNEAG